MTTSLRRFAGLAVLPLVSAAAISTPSAAAADRSAVAAVVAESRPAAQVVLRTGEPLLTPTLVPADTSGGVTTQAVTFVPTYTGFTAAARASFQRALNAWAPLVNSTVPITVSASFEPLGPGILGSAGASFIFRNFTGAPRINTWYVDSLANKRAGSQLNPAADIIARFSSSRSDWHFGTGPAPVGRYDFQSVVMHEIGHGLAITGGASVNGATGSVRRASPTPADPLAYARFAETAAGTLLVNMPNNSAQVGTALRSNNLFFDSPSVRAANAGQPARIYAPATFQPGSSFSHLNEATFPPGNAHSLMTPQLSSGETIRSPGGITRAILTTMGW